MDERQRMQELIGRLNAASKAYYDGNDAIMSDDEWDAMYAELRKLEAQNRLIAETAKWTERDASSRLQMPEVEDGASTNVRWQRIHADLAKNFHVVLKTVVAREEEEHGGVWELPIDVSYEASLERLVEFLHALGQAEGAMFDVRELEIQVQNNGFLRGRYVLTCAYMKKES